MMAGGTNSKVLKALQEHSKNNIPEVQKGSKLGIQQLKC
jgi:hypothetical protein